MNFIFNLVEAHDGVHGDFSLKEGRPLSGHITSLITVKPHFTIYTNLKPFSFANIVCVCG